MENYTRVNGAELFVDIKAVPGASKSEIAGVKDGRLRVRIAAAPEDGKANAALVELFAKTLGCPKRDVRVTAGEKSRLKTLALPAGCRSALEKIAGGG